MMKYIVSVATTLLLSAQLFGQQDPVIMEVDGDKVTKSEFLQIYLKNNNDPKYDKASLDEYMELFKRFKLKVAEAEALGYDTIPELKKELEGYQKQLALPYLVDSTVTEALLKEAYDHMKTEVRASHILVQVQPDASPEDTLAAYNKLLEMRKRIMKGEDFGAIARGDKHKGGSEDPSVRDNGGDLGYFTAFQMVYPFEKAAYDTKVGEVSMPFRTRFGYHIVKVTDKRPARGTIKVAHLMIAARKGQLSSGEIGDAEKRANELYEKIQNGADFNELVKQYSDDPSSSSNGGILPQFGTGATTRMVPEFEDAAFSLKNDGDISTPVQTDYGFHIIKRISWEDVPAYSEMKRELENRVNRDDRSKTTQDSFVEKLKKEYNYKDKSKCGMKWFDSNVDSTYYMGKWNADDLKSNKVIFIADKQKFRQQDFATYLENNFRGTKKEAISSMLDAKYKAWVKETMLEIEKEKLPVKYPEYKALMTEYHDGILLYEVMTDKVWNKAIKDTAGLRNFYEDNKANYMWGQRIEGTVYEMVNPEMADSVFRLIQKYGINDTVVEIANKTSNLNVTVRTGKFEVDKTTYLKDKGLGNKTGLVNGLNKPYESNGKYYVVFIENAYNPEQKELSEAKGMITSDYQTFLEKEWLKELEQKHTIKVYEDVLYSLGK